MQYIFIVIHFIIPSLFPYPPASTTGGVPINEKNISGQSLYHSNCFYVRNNSCHEYLHMPKAFLQLILCWVCFNFFGSPAFSSHSQSGKIFLQTDKNGKDFEGSRPNLILLYSIKNNTFLFKSIYFTNLDQVTNIDVHFHHQMFHRSHSQLLPFCSIIQFHTNYKDHFAYNISTSSLVPYWINHYLKPNELFQ